MAGPPRPVPARADSVRGSMTAADRSERDVNEGCPRAGETTAHRRFRGDRLAAHHTLRTQARTRSHMRALRLLPGLVLGGADHQRHGDGRTQRAQPNPLLDRLPRRGRPPARMGYGTVPGVPADHKFLDQMLAEVSMRIQAVKCLLGSPSQMRGGQAVDVRAGARRSSIRLGRRPFLEVWALGMLRDSRRRSGPHGAMWPAGLLTCRGVGEVQALPHFSVVRGLPVLPLGGLR